MKKREAQVLTLGKSKLMIEYLEQFLTDKEQITGRIEFNRAPIGGQNVCVADLFIPTKNWERHLNLEITIDHCDVLYEQLFSDILSTFLASDTMGVSRYYEIKGMMGHSFYGISVINILGSRIEVNFLQKGQKFYEITEFYNRKIDEYENSFNMDQTSVRKR